MAIYDLTTDTITTLEIGDILNCPYSGSSVSVTLPKGTFQLECWGAEGGYGYSSAISYTGGKGGYSIGSITFDEDSSLNIYVGGQGTAGSTTQDIKTGGWNGGGSSGYNRGGSGGGGTDIRIDGTELTDRIIVAGGGGGGCYYSGYHGGAGGGESGVDGNGYSPSYRAKAGTQSAGGLAGGYSSNTGAAGSLGQGGNANTTSSNYNRSGGGGGGYYGGGGGGYRSSSSYYYYGCSGGGGGSGYVDSTLTDAVTYAGNTSFTDPDGTTVTGHSGAGYARITVIDITKEDEGGKQKPLNFKVYADGKWVDAYAGYAKVNGSWRKLKSAYTYKDGTWKGSFENLESAPWSYISALSSSGTAANVWSVGDTKSIKLSGTVGTLSLDTTLLVYILGFDHNTKNGESSGITFGGFKTSSTTGVHVCLVDDNYRSSKTDGTKTFNMNHWGSSSDPYNTNYGGWKGCDLRYDILGSTNVAPSGYGSTATTSRVGYNPSNYDIVNAPVANTLLAAFPEDVRAVMKPNTIYTDNVGNFSNVKANVTTSVDYLWLLSAYEIFGTRAYANEYEQNYQAQYQYFIDGGSTVKYRHSDITSTSYWLERSPNYSGAFGFCYVNTVGSYVNGNLSTSSIGLAPAFLV